MWALSGVLIRLSIFFAIMVNLICGQLPFFDLTSLSKCRRMGKDYVSGRVGI